MVADIGKFAVDNPPTTPFDVPTGVQYALETYRGEFLVTDGHHNRVYQVTRDGDVSVLIQFGNIVPTGLETSGNTIYMAEAGPVPHLPEDGKVVSFKPKSPGATEVASGPLPGEPGDPAPLLVDVEFGRGRDLYALSQGHLRARWRSCRCSGGPEHRQPREGEPGRHVQHRRRRPQPADLGRIHQEHRVRRHAHRRDLEGRECLEPATRRVALRTVRQRSRPGHRREHYTGAASCASVTFPCGSEYGLGLDAGTEGFGSPTTNFCARCAVARPSLSGSIRRSSAAPMSFASFPTRRVRGGSSAPSPSRSTRTGSKPPLPQHGNPARTTQTTPAAGGRLSERDGFFIRRGGLWLGAGAGALSLRGSGCRNLASGVYE